MADIQVLSPETKAPVYTLDPSTTVFRWEPDDVPTPMTPHASPYAPYGHFEFGYEHLFLVDQSALDDLTALRGAQGYFQSNVVLRSTTVGELLAMYPNAVFLEDQKFNMTVLGGDRKGALILAVK